MKIKRVLLLFPPTHMLYMQSVLSVPIVISDFDPLLAYLHPGEGIQNIFLAAFRSYLKIGGLLAIGVNCDE